MNQEKDPQNLESENEIREENTAAEQTAAPAAEAEQESAAPETSAEKTVESEEEGDLKSSKKGNNGGFVHSQRFRHGSISTAFSVGFIVVVVLVNILVGILGNRFPSINLDLTKDSKNSLSDASLKVVDQVKVPTTIYILATQDQVQSDSLYANEGISTSSQVGTLAEKIAERNKNIKVQYIDLDKNPTFAADYKSDNVTAGDVIVKTDKRYRVLTYTDLFDIETSSDYSSQQVYSNVEGAYASALNSVIAEKLPVVAFDTGHSEKVDMTQYKSLLTNNSFETKDFNLLTDAIPDGTQLIVLGYPTTDYTDAEIQKLSAYLSNKGLAADRSLMISFYPSQGSMPKLSNFLEEWGIQVPQSVVVETDQTKYAAGNPTYLLSDIQTTLSLSGQVDQNGQSTTDYGYFITPDSTPINLLFASKGNKLTYSLAKSSATSYVVDSNTKQGENPPKASYNTAALSQDSVAASDGKSYKSNVIAVGSSEIFEDGIINSSTFGDGKYMADLSKYATGTNNTATQVSITPKELNATDIALPEAAVNALGLGVFTLLIPLAILIAGVTVYHKRRHL